MNFDAELIERMEKYIDKNGAGGCWISRYSPENNGYSRISIDRKNYRFNRVMLFFSDQTKIAEFQNGSIWAACHKCRTKNCINPAHLEWGTRQKNRDDMVRDGTVSNGEKRYNAKLTDAHVLEIRREKAQTKITLKKISEKYGVDISLIGRIIQRKAWKHI